MLVSVGTRSVPKITAITRAFSRYPELWLNVDNKIEFCIIPKDVRNIDAEGQAKDNFSGVSCNPMSLSETIEGAKNRAINAYNYALENMRYMQLWRWDRSSECIVC